MPIALEPLAEVARAFNISVVPYSVLINKKGQIVHKAFGVNANLDEKIEQILQNDLKNYLGKRLKKDVKLGDPLRTTLF